MISSPISSTNSFFMASVDPGVSISPLGKEKSKNGSQSSMTSDTQDSSTDGNSCASSEEVQTDPSQSVHDEEHDKQPKRSANDIMESTTKKDSLESTEHKDVENTTESNFKENSSDNLAENVPEKSPRQSSEAVDDKRSEAIILGNNDTPTQRETTEIPPSDFEHGTEMITDEEACTGAGDISQPDYVDTIDGESRITNNLKDVARENPETVDKKHLSEVCTESATTQQKSGEVMTENLENSKENSPIDNIQGCLGNITKNELDDKMQDPSTEIIVADTESKEYNVQDSDSGAQNINKDFPSEDKRTSQVLTSDIVSEKSNTGKQSDACDEEHRF